MSDRRCFSEKVEEGDKTQVVCSGLIMPATLYWGHMTVH